MGNIVGIIQAIHIGVLVAEFLLNTHRVPKAIELCKECLILLNNRAFENKQEFTNVLYVCINKVLLKGYHLKQDYRSAIERCKEILVVYQKCGLTAQEGGASLNLAIMHTYQGEFKEAECLYKKALSIMKENGDRHGEARCYGGLGVVLNHIGEVGKAEEYLKKAIVIRKEIGDRQGEADDYESLGNVFQALAEYVKAKEYLQKALKIREDMSDRQGEATDYENLGTVFVHLGEYGRAEECIQKSLVIAKEISDKYIESSCYAKLGSVFANLSKYGKAEEYYQQALAIAKESGNRHTEAHVYGEFGALFQSLGEYAKAEEYHEKALAIHKATGAKQGEAMCYGNLGSTLASLGKYIKAEEYLQRALAISKETGERRGEAACYGTLGTVSIALGDPAKAEEYLQKALVIRKEIGDKRGEAADYGNLGTVFRSRREYVKAREYHMKQLTISKEIGTLEDEFSSHFKLTKDMLMEGNIQDAITNLFESVEKSEKMRSFLNDSDQYKIAFLEKRVFPYQLLSFLLCLTGNPSEALHVEELGRARALADLMLAQYSTGKQVAVNPWQLLVDIERIMRKESNCNCLYISYFEELIFLWILQANKPVCFRQINVNDCFGNDGRNVARHVKDVFGNETFRGFHVLPLEGCEDRSLIDRSNAGHCHPSQDSSQNDVQVTTFRPVEIEDEDGSQQSDPSLAQCYRILIAPVGDLLDKPEIIIAPDRALYKVPFAALSDESGKLLSETFRIRIVPSLTTLKLIQDSPADYHSQTGALIVGEPEISEVFYKGHVETLCPLPSAKKEAEVIGRLLGAQPLLGQQATKQAVLESIHSVALIHFAAHGNAERGEIALASPFPDNGIPQEEEYLLTMTEISQVRLQAKLVVLSCCHSARGQIRSEGVIGIARAFLGSGARSVLVALWALEDKATEQLMFHFYEHLVRGDSASESLHQAMKWMRNNGYSEVQQWAPFMLIGDDVTFNFGK